MCHRSSVQLASDDSPTPSAALKAAFFTVQQGQAADETINRLDLLVLKNLNNSYCFLGEIVETIVDICHF
jgi:hypothetical protein